MSEPAIKDRFGFSPSYSLVELLVVIAVITVIGISSIPNIFNRNDRLSLDSSANQLRQVIIDAETRSKAPDKTDGAGATQIYQVAFGNFSQANFNNLSVTATGTPTTNNVSLERGLASCDTGDTQGGFSTLRTVTLPRGVYISAVYPTPYLSDSRTVIRFTVGRDGFSCGTYSNPSVKSTSIYNSTWNGIRLSSGGTTSRYFVVTLSSQKVADKRFVTVDRETGDVAVARTNPQSYFTPVSDSLAPRWTDDNPPNHTVDPNKFTLSVTCSNTNSSIVIGYPRAKDRVNDAASAGDPNLLVTYDLSWDTGSGAQTLAVGYFEDLSHDTVRYQFTTNRFTSANQPKQITVVANAVDALGRHQPTTDPDATLAQRSKTFILSCGAIVSDPTPDPIGPPGSQSDPGGSSTACDPIIPITSNKNDWTRRLTRLFIAPALAMPTPSCPVEPGH